MNEVYRAKINEEGRMVIPAACRKRLGLQAGQEVLLTLNEEGVQLTTFDRALRHFQDEVSRLVGPGRSLSAELIAERRAEAAKEGNG